MDDLPDQAEDPSGQETLFRILGGVYGGEPWASDCPAALECSSHALVHEPIDEVYLATARRMGIDHSCLSSADPFFYWPPSP